LGKKHPPFPVTHLHGALDGLDHVDLVGRRGRRAGQVVDLIHLAEKGEDHVVLVEDEVGVPNPVLYVLALASEQVVHHVHNVTL
jgi:hypothetical protein